MCHLSLPFCQLGTWTIQPHMQSSTSWASVSIIVFSCSVFYWDGWTLAWDRFSILTVMREKCQLQFLGEFLTHRGHLSWNCRNKPPVLTNQPDLFSLVVRVQYVFPLCNISIYLGCGLQGEDREGIGGPRHRIAWTSNSFPWRHVV